MSADSFHHRVEYGKEGLLNVDEDNRYISDLNEAW